MPNWVANKIRFIGDRDNVASVLKLVIVDKDYLENLKKGEFDLCKHIQSHAAYNGEDKKVCDKCEHGKFCPLLSPKGEDVNDWEKMKVCDYGVRPDRYNEGDVYFGILIPQPRAIYQGGTNTKIQKRNARFGIKDWLDWNTDNWGTKWNPSRDDTTFEWLDDTTAELTFRTAWSLPEPWLIKLGKECKKHNVEIEGESADEDFGGAMGEFRTPSEDGGKDGIVITIDSMNRELYERCWGEGSLDDCDDED
jgi:hypothetical protein